MSQEQIDTDVIELHDDSVESELSELVERLVSTAQAQGADESKASVADSIQVEVAARDREIENVSFEQNRAFRITVYIDKREGSAVTSDISDEAIERTVSQAINIARYTEADPCNGLPDKHRLATNFQDLEQNHPRIVEIARLKEEALAADRASLDFDDCIVPSHGADSTRLATCSISANSLGFMNANRHTMYGISATAAARSDAGMQMDYWYDHNCRYEPLESADSIGRHAAKRAKDRLNPRQVPTGTYPVMFDSWVAPALFSPLLEAITGGNLYRQESYLQDSLGKQVATNTLTLREYPRIPGRSQSRNCDSDGVTTTEKTIINNGVVDTYLMGTYSARRLKLESTGNAGGVSNVHVEADFTSIDQLLKEMNRGFLVTSLIGDATNLVTGDYSRGAAGFWVEDGEIAYPVDNVTIASKLDAIYEGLVGYGDNVQDRTSIKTGSILIDSMTIASN